MAKRREITNNSNMRKENNNSNNKVWINIPNTTHAKSMRKFALYRKTTEKWCIGISIPLVES